MLLLQGFDTLFSWLYSDICQSRLSLGNFDLNPIFNLWGFDSNYIEGYRDQKTPEEGWMVQWLKCGNNKDEAISPNVNKNYSSFHWYFVFWLPQTWGTDVWGIPLLLCVVRVVFCSIIGYFKLKALYVLRALWMFHKDIVHGIHRSTFVASKLLFICEESVHHSLPSWNIHIV